MITQDKEELKKYREEARAIRKYKPSVDALAAGNKASGYINPELPAHTAFFYAAAFLCEMRKAGMDFDRMYIPALEHAMSKITSGKAHFSSKCSERITTPETIERMMLEGLRGSIADDDITVKEYLRKMTYDK